MTKKINYFVYLLITIITLLNFSCTVKKGTTSQAVSAIKDSTEVKLSEDARKEFEYLYIEGIKQRTFENYDSAIKIFSRCLEIDPSSSATLYEMANIHVSKGDFQSSMFLMEKAVSINPDNQYYHLLLVKIYQQNKLFAKAASEYETLVQLVPENPDYIFYQAALLTMAGKTNEALAIYNQLESRLGVTEAISVGKQQVYTQSGNNTAAYGEIEKLINSNPSNPKYYGLLAEIYLSNKNREKALENYNKILEIDPKDGFVHLSLANYYLEGKDFKKAYEHIRLAFKNSELDLETKAQMYMLLIEPGANKISEEKQLELLNILIETHIDDERPRAMMVDYLINKKKPEEARKEMRLVLDIKKDTYMYWERLLMLNNDLLDWQSMSEDSKKALTYFPDQPLIYILRSVGLLQQKRYDELLTVLDSGVVHSKNDPKLLSQFYTYKAEAFYNLNRFNEAFDVFDKVVELDPENFMAMNNYAYYLSLKSERLDIAEKMSAKVIQANPENATYLDTYAWVFFKKKDYVLAKFYMENALSKVTEDSSVLVEHYGDILFFLNDKQNALIQWKKALEMGNNSKILKRKITEKRYIETTEN
ncbi:MAG: tetratricopeptide repeat protein [Mariniphaga sp.]